MLSEVASWISPEAEDLAKNFAKKVSNHSAIANSIIPTSPEAVVLASKRLSPVVAAQLT